jgi:hypothetical protein
MDAFQKLVYAELEKYQQPQPTSVPINNTPDPEQGDQLYPADRQDILVEFLEDHPDKIFRREDFEDEFGWSKDQVTRDLRQLKKDGRIGYQAEKVKLPNARNPSKPFWRHDAVYFALKPEEPKPEWTFPIILENEDQVEEFIKSWKNA